MHALGARRIDPDLDQRPRQRQFLDGLAVDLERDVGLGLAVGRGLIEVGPQGRFDQVDEAAQDAVLVGVDHGIEPGLEVGQDRRSSLVAIPLRRGIEARLEQPDDKGGKTRVLEQGLLHVGVRIGDSGLAQVLAIGAQNDDLAPAQTGPDDQAVEAVAFDLAAPDAAERLLELGPDGAEVDGPAVAGFQAKVVDHDEAAVVERDRERNLVDHLEAHMLEHGQSVGQGDRAVRMVELEADLMLAGLQGTAQAHADLAVGQGLLDHVDVADRGLAVEPLAVAGAEGPVVTAVEGQPALLAMRRNQRVLKLVGPGPCRLDDLGLDGVGIVIGNRPRLGADEHVGTGQRRVAELGVPVAALATEGVLHDALYAAAEVGVVAVTRHIDEARHEPLEVIATQEQGNPLAFLQVEDAEAGIQQMVLGYLEQFVAGEVLEDVGERLAVMAVGRQVGTLQHPADLPPQQGNFAGVVVVGRRGEQADEQVLAGHLALGAETTHGDGVHVDRPVDRGEHVGLGDHQRIGPGQEFPHLGTQVLEIGELAERIEVGVAEQAEAGALVEGDLGLAAAALEIESPVAEKGEVVVVNPAQKGVDLVAVLGRNRPRCRLEIGGDLEHLGPQVLPVGDGDPDIGQNLLDGGGDLRQMGRRLPADLDVHEGFGGHAVTGIARFENLVDGLVAAAHLDDRVDDQMDGDVAAAQFDGQRIDQERHVVVDHLDHRVVRLPAVFLEIGVVDPDLGLAGLALGAEPPMGERRAEQLVMAACGDIAGRDTIVIEADERADRRALGFAQTFLRLFQKTPD